MSHQTIASAHITTKNFSQFFFTRTKHKTKQYSNLGKN